MAKPIACHKDIVAMTLDLSSGVESCAQTALQTAAPPELTKK